MLRNEKAASSNFFLIIMSFLFLLLAQKLESVEQYPYSDPQKGYGIENDGKPWFDGKDYPFFQEMYDGKSLKPQEEGSYQKFPKSSVPVRVVLGKIVKVYDPFIPAIFGDGSGSKGNPREFFPKNPTEKTKESIRRGKVLFNTYCSACHGEDGQSRTIIVEKGVPAPPITAFFKIPTAASHLHRQGRR